MTLPLGSDPYTDLLGQLGLGGGNNISPDTWLATVDQPTIPPMPVEGPSTRNEPNTVAAPPGAAATGGQIGLAIDAAMNYLGRPYQWGGNGQNGNSVDCSGLVYAAFKAAGFNVQRYRAVDYGHMGTPVDPQDARPGDIVYFDNPGTSTDHVGIYLGSGQFIEAPQPGQQVQISKLRGGAQIRRIFPEGDFKTLPTNAAGNPVVNTATGKRFVGEGKIAVNDPVTAILSQLGVNTNPDALIAGLNAKGSLDKLMNPMPVLGHPGTTQYVQNNPVDYPHYDPNVGHSGNLDQWISQALAHMGLDPSWAYDVKIVAEHESSGDPHAINNWDSNAKAGHPSEGVMQTIQSTFDAYRDKNLPNDIFNPVANIVAALRYGIARYGSIANIPGVRAIRAGGPYRGY